MSAVEIVLMIAVTILAVVAAYAQYRASISRKNTMAILKQNMDTLEAREMAINPYFVPATY